MPRAEEIQEAMRTEELILVMDRPWQIIETRVQNANTNDRVHETCEEAGVRLQSLKVGMEVDISLCSPT